MPSISQTATNSPVEEATTFSVDYDVSHGDSTSQNITIRLIYTPTNTVAESKTESSVGSSETRPGTITHQLPYYFEEDWGGAGTNTWELEAEEEDGTTDTSSTFESRAAARAIYRFDNKSDIQSTAPVSALDGEITTFTGGIENVGSAEEDARFFYAEGAVSGDEPLFPNDAAVQAERRISVQPQSIEQRELSVEVSGEAGTTRDYALGLTPARTDGASGDSVAFDDILIDSTTIATPTVNILNANDPVAPKETLEITVQASVDSNGGEYGGALDLYFLGKRRDSASVTISPGSSVEKTLTFDDISGDEVGQQQAIVQARSRPINDEVAVEILPEARAEITGVSYPDTSQIDAEETWSVSLKNPTERTATGSVGLSFEDRDAVATGRVSLSPGATTTVDLTTRLRPTEAGTETWRIDSVNDSAEGIIQVADPGDFRILSRTSPTSVNEGRSFTVTLEIASVREAEGPLRVFVDGDQRARRQVFARGRRDGYLQRKTVEVDVPTDAGEAASNVDVLVDVPGDQESFTIDINSDGFFQVASASIDGPYAPSDTATVTADVENTGTADDTVFVEFDIDNGGRTTGNFAINAGNTKTISLSADVPSSEQVTTATLLVDGGVDQREFDVVVREPGQPRTGDGWFVEVDTGNGTLRPAIQSDPEFEPGVYGVAEVRVPVRQEDRWLDLQTPAAMRVWLDGDRLPIDELVDVERDDERDTLVGRGGAQLRAYRDSIEVPNATTAEAVRDLLDLTDYQADVDDYQASVRAGVTLRETSTEQEWEQRLVADPGDRRRWEVTSNGPRPLQYAYFRPVQEFDTGSGGSVISDADFHNGEAYEADNDALNTRIFNASVTVDYDLRRDDGPDETTAAALALRYKTPEPDPDFAGEALHPGFEVVVGDSSVQVPADSLAERTSPAWFAVRLPDGVQAGEATDIEIDFNRDSRGDPSTSPRIQVGSVLVYDRTVQLTPSDNGVSSGVLQGVDLYPGRDGGPYAETTDVTSVEAIESVTVTQTVSDQAAGREIGVSANRGADFTSSESTDSLSTAFDRGDVQRVRTRHRLVGVTGSGDATTPQGRNAPMTLQSASITAVVSDRPLIRDRQRRGRLIEVLRDIASDTEAVFEVTYDADEQRQRVSWTWPGQRDPDDIGGVVSVDVAKRSSEAAQRVVAFGSAFPVEQSIQAPREGESRRLQEGWIAPGSEEVRDPNSGRRYFRGVDYSIDYYQDRSAFQVLEESRIPEEKPIDIDYEAKPRAVHIAQDYQGQDPDTLDTAEIDNLGIQSPSAVGQAALVAAEDLKDPQREAELILSDINPTASVLGGVDVDLIPFDTETVSGIDVAADRVVLRLGNRLSKTEAVSGLRDRVSRASDRL